MSTAVTEKKSIADKAITYRPLEESKDITISVKMVKNFLAAPTKRGAQPNDGDCIKFMMLCQSRELNPWVGDCYMLGYDTKDGPKFELITAFQALLKRAEAHDNYDGLEGGLIVLNDNQVVHRDGALDLQGDVIIGAWAKAHRDDHRVPHSATVKLSTYNTGQSRWAKDAGGMIVKVAKAAALREAFPNTVGGMYIQDEMDNSTVVVQAKQEPQTLEELDADVEGAFTPPPASEPIEDEQGGQSESQEDSQPSVSAQQSADEALMVEFLSDDTIANFARLTTLKGIEQLASEMAQATDPQDDAMLAAIAAAKRIHVDKLRAERNKPAQQELL